VHYYLLPFFFSSASGVGFASLDVNCKKYFYFVNPSCHVNFICVKHQNRHLCLHLKFLMLLLILKTHLIYIIRVIVYLQITRETCYLPLCMIYPLSFFNSIVILGFCALNSPANRASPSLGVFSPTASSPSPLHANNLLPLPLHAANPRLRTFVDNVNVNNINGIDSSPSNPNSDVKCSSEQFLPVPNSDVRRRSITTNNKSSNSNDCNASFSPDLNTVPVAAASSGLRVVFKMSSEHVRVIAPKPPRVSHRACNFHDICKFHIIILLFSEKNMFHVFFTCPCSGGDIEKAYVFGFFCSC
jgi:hypothetical protein